MTPLLYIQIISTIQIPFGTKSFFQTLAGFPEVQYVPVQVSGETNVKLRLVPSLNCSAHHLWILPVSIIELPRPIRQ